MFVCAGNICRSPTAEGVMKKLLHQSALSGHIYVDSAGILGYNIGNAPDSRSAECAAGHGVDLSCLRARQIRAEDFAEFDLILAMDSHNLWNLETKRPDGDPRYQKAVVKKLLSYAPAYGEDVPDPYYLNGFEKVYEMIAVACQNLLAELSH